jgi:hypothetical protein
MLMADILAYFFVVLGFMLAFPGLWLLCRGLWPDLVTESNCDCQKGLIKPFLVGLPVTGLAIFLAIVLSKIGGPVGGVAAIATFCLYIIYASTGVSGLVTVIGQRLPSPADKDRPWNATIRGGVVLELSWLLPLLGWFVLLPASFVIGAGTATRSLIKHSKRRSKVESQIQSAPGAEGEAISDFGGNLGASQ